MTQKVLALISIVVLCPEALYEPYDCEEVSFTDTVDVVQFDEEDSPYRWRYFQSGKINEYVEYLQRVELLEASRSQLKRTEEADLGYHGELSEYRYL